MGTAFGVLHAEIFGSLVGWYFPQVCDNTLTQAEECIICILVTPEVHIVEIQTSFAVPKVDAVMHERIASGKDLFGFCLCVPPSHTKHPSRKELTEKAVLSI